MLLPFFLLLSSQITVCIHTHANPVIGLFPGLDIDIINRVNSRYKCAAICEYQELNSDTNYSAVFVAGNSIEDHVLFNDTLMNINVTTPIVLLFERPMEQLKKQITEKILRQFSVTSILGYHSSSPYHIYEDYFDEINNDLSRPVNIIWLRDQKIGTIVNRKHKGMAVTREIAFVRNCEIKEEEYDIEYDRTRIALHNISYKFQYKLSKIDECLTSSAEERLVKLKKEIADYDFFIFDQEKFCDEYYPEIPFIKELSVPIRMFESTTRQSSFTILRNTSLNIVDWSRARYRFYEWTDRYTKVPFHGTGVCDICTALINEQELTRSQEIEPYFSCIPRLPMEEKEEMEMKHDKENNATNAKAIIGVKVFGGLIGSYITITCIIALYFPVKNTINRYYERYYLHHRV